MNVRFVARAACSLWLIACFAGLVSARDCGGCGAPTSGSKRCDGSSNPSGECPNKQCAKDGSGACDAGCSCGADNKPNAACGCT